MFIAVIKRHPSWNDVILLIGGSVRWSATAVHDLMLQLASGRARRPHGTGPPAPPVGGGARGAGLVTSAPSNRARRRQSGLTPV